MAQFEIDLRTEAASAFDQAVSWYFLSEGAGPPSTEIVVGSADLAAGLHRRSLGVPEEADLTAFLAYWRACELTAAQAS